MFWHTREATTHVDSHHKCVSIACVCCKKKSTVRGVFVCASVGVDSLIHATPNLTSRSLKIRSPDHHHRRDKQAPHGTFCPILLFLHMLTGVFVCVLVCLCRNHKIHSITGNIISFSWGRCLLLSFNVRLTVRALRS